MSGLLGEWIVQSKKGYFFTLDSQTGAVPANLPHPPSPIFWIDGDCRGQAYIRFTAARPGTVFGTHESLGPSSPLYYVALDAPIQSVDEDSSLVLQSTVSYFGPCGTPNEMPAGEFYEANENDPAITGVPLLNADDLHPIPLSLIR